MTKLTQEINTAISNLSDMQQKALASYKSIEESDYITNDMIDKATDDVNSLYLCIENAHNVKGLTDADYKDSVKLCKEILDNLSIKKQSLKGMAR